jgi:competence protein ComEC
MCLDAGGIPNYANRTSGFDIGEDVVSPYLWSRRIARLDVVALSHLHEDHAGGAEALIRNFRPKELWTGSLPEGPLTLAVQQAARQVGATQRRLRAGEEIAYGGVRFEVLAVGPEEPSPAASDRDSLVLRVWCGRRSFLLTGDLDPVVERALVSQDRLLKSDVLKVPHHGSRRSSSMAFLEMVRPAVALISVGAGNAYGHPHPDVLSRLDQVHAVPLRTDVWGLVRVWTDGKGLELDTFRWSAARERILLRRL